jgi:hypothetical protein
LETEPTRMCALLVGLPGVVVVGVGEWPSWLRIVITSMAALLGAPTCCGGVVAHRHGRRDVELVDLAVFRRPTRLVWRSSGGDARPVAGRRPSRTRRSGRPGVG